jgi:hypothetical protein
MQKKKPQEAQAAQECSDRMPAMFSKKSALFLAVLVVTASTLWPQPQQQLTPITINYPTRTG